MDCPDRPARGPPWRRGGGDPGRRARWHCGATDGGAWKTSAISVARMFSAEIRASTMAHRISSIMFWGTVSVPIPNVHAGVPVLPEVFQHVAVAGERSWAVRHRGARLSHDRDILPRPPVQPRMLIDEERVTKEGAGSGQADLMRPLDRSDAVTAHHLVELGHRLAAVNGEWEVALARGRDAVAQELSVQVSICAGEIMPDSRPLGCLAISSQSRRAASNFCRPAGSFHSYSSRWDRRTTHRDGGVAGGEHAAQPAPGDQIDPARVVAGDIDEGGHAGEKKLTVGGLRAGEPAFVVRPVGTRALEQTRHVHLRERRAPRECRDSSLRGPGARGH